MDLELKLKNCWDVYADKVADMDALADGYIEFLSACKTEREAVKFICEKLRKAGFVESVGGAEFQGEACFRVMRGKTVFVARKGKLGLDAGFRLFGAHVDSPRLDLKQRPLYEDCGVSQAKTHYYGGIRKHQWLGRPLALHGVVAKKDGALINVAIGEDKDDPVFTIPDLLPHLAYKQVEQKLSDAFEAEKLNIIFGHSPAAKAKKDKDEKGLIKRKVLQLLHEKYGINEDDLFSAELQAVPAGPARYVGLDKAMIGGYGQDDRACVYLGLEAMLAGKPGEHCQVLIFWDKEEIGSEGSTSAKSLFMEYCLEDLIRAWSPRARLSQVFDAAKAISADVHPAMDPDYQDLHEKMNSAILGFGPVFCKFTGHRGKVGANDAHAEYVAWLRKLFDEAGVPWQMAELGKVDLGGGGTVAKFLAAYGMDIIDCGPPTLGLHSPFELCGKADLYAALQGYRAFLES